MTIEDVDTQLACGHQLCIAIDQSSAFPGYVRSVYIRSSNLVVVEFEPYGMDEGMHTSTVSIPI